MKNLAKMKFAAVVSLILTIPVLYSSCSKDDDGGKKPVKKEDLNKLSAKTILGKWKVTSRKKIDWEWKDNKAVKLKGEKKDTPNYIYELNADGKGIFHNIKSHETEKSPFEYTLDVSKKTLIVNFKLEGGSTLKRTLVITKFDANNVEMNHIEPTKKEDFTDDKGKLEYSQEFLVLKKQK